MRVDLLEQEVTVTPGGPPVLVTVHIANTSTIVEAYDVTVADPLPWLQVQPGDVRLLPGTDEDVRLTLMIRAEDLVPVQRLPLRLAVRGRSDPALRFTAMLELVVGPVRGPVKVRIEPSTLRARDATTGLFRVLVDNRSSNEPLRVQLSGQDPENQARFAFSNPVLEVPPARIAASRLRVDVPMPEPGEQLNRTLMITASDGRRSFEGTATFVQAASAAVVDPPVALRLDPSTIRSPNASSGTAMVMVDNRRGTRAQRVSLTARDDEGTTRFSLSPTEFEVPPGQTRSAKLQLRAPRPDGGETVNRPITVTAWNGEETVEARGTFVQEAPNRRPLARILMTIAGAALIVLGANLLWANVLAPAVGLVALSGTRWNFSAATAVFGPEVDVDPVAVFSELDKLGLRGIVDAIINAGSMTIFLAAVALFGLTGTTGRLTRAAAVLCLLFVAAIAVIVAIADRVLANVDVQFSFGGLALVVLGCLVAFVGGLLARR